MTRTLADGKLVGVFERVAVAAALATEIHPLVAALHVRCRLGDRHLRAGIIARALSCRLGHLGRSEITGRGGVWMSEVTSDMKAVSATVAGTRCAPDELR